MQTYVSLMKWTDKGIESIEEAPKRTEECIELLEKMGGKQIGFYYLIGEYDMIGIAEAPSEEVALAYLTKLGSTGNVRTTTQRAFTREEAAAIMEKLS